MILSLTNNWSCVARSLFAAVTEAFNPGGAQRQRVFETIRSRHSDIVNSVCFGFAHRRADFDDLRQEAWLNLWKGAASFRGSCELSSWVYRVAFNSCVSAMRSNDLAEKSRADFSNAMEIADADDSLSDEIDHLHSLIASLGATDRSIIIMWLDERPYEEIADVMGLPRNTVATRLHRIRAKLKKEYTRESNN